MYSSYTRISKTLTLLVGGVSFLLLTASNAAAHVKWFCAYDVAGHPNGLENVICTDFELLIALSAALLLIGCLIESMPIGRALVRGLNLATEPLQKNSNLLIKAGCGFLLVALWTLGGILLTPELKTDLAWVSWMQLAMAFSLLWRQTQWLASVGIVILFGMAVSQYGTFHLMDYPVFLGVAAYLAVTSYRERFDNFDPIDILRYTGAVTLMWASVEKWAYPQWTYELFLTKPEMTMGFDPAFYMRAAGAVEFALSFALLLSPLVRRTASLILLGAFITAIIPFGKVDAIGHMPIIAVLVALIADSRPGGSIITFPTTDNPRAVWRSVFLLPAGFMAALVATVAAYYGLHSYIFGSPLI